MKISQELEKSQQINQKLSIQLTNMKQYISLKEIEYNESIGKLKIQKDEELEVIDQKVRHLLYEKEKKIENLQQINEELEFKKKTLEKIFIQLNQQI